MKTDRRSYNSRHLSSSKTNINNKIKKQLLICLVSIFTIIAGCAVFGNMRLSAHDNINKSDAVYTSITIKSGDTLWSIAEEYLPDDITSVPEYINELKKLNGLKGDTIQSGMNLIVSVTDN